MGLFTKSKTTSASKLAAAQSHIDSAAGHLVDAQALAATEAEANQTSASFFAQEATAASIRQAKATSVLAALPTS